MKKMLLLLSSIAIAFVSAGASERDVLSSYDENLLKNAVFLMDSGMPREALSDLEDLSGKYPDNYVIRYETLYALYLMGDYDEIVKRGKNLAKHPDVSPVYFQLYGNACDMAGKPKEARKIYEKGLEKFPDSGILWLELGNLDFAAGEYIKALPYYNRGIDVMPGFASNYYRAAIVYLMSNQPVWGLVYAETAMMLSPNKERFEEMAAGIAACYKENISISQDSVSVRLTPDRKMTLDKDTGDKVYLDFPGIYEGCVVRGLHVIRDSNDGFSPDSIKSLSLLRKNIVEAYFDVCDNMYHNSMFLLEYQKKILDSGFWDCYNYWLFSSVNPDEFSRWESDNGELFDEFVRWYNDGNMYGLDLNRTVGSGSIYRDYVPVDLAHAFAIQASLLSGRNFLDELEKESEESVTSGDDVPLSPLPE